MRRADLLFLRKQLYRECWYRYLGEVHVGIDIEYDSISMMLAFSCAIWPVQRSGATVWFEPEPYIEIYIRLWFERTNNRMGAMRCCHLVGSSVTILIMAAMGWGRWILPSYFANSAFLGQVSGIIMVRQYQLVLLFRKNEVTLEKYQGKDV